MRFRRKWEVSRVGDPAFHGRSSSCWNGRRSERKSIETVRESRLLLLLLLISFRLVSGNVPSVADGFISYPPSSFIFFWQRKNGDLVVEMKKEAPKQVAAGFGHYYRVLSVFILSDLFFWLPYIFIGFNLFLPGLTYFYWVSPFF